ncbi:MAG: hypothetical protein HYY24_15915 [Verrucomicrobia bacterium]|nr:hypothetical protein [Verrucomicrobiota bacterium]
MPALIQWALWLPLVAIPLLATAALFAGRAWTREYSSLAGRLHYAPVSVAGLALLGWLNHWNPLGFHFLQRTRAKDVRIPHRSR